MLSLTNSAHKTFFAAYGRWSEPPDREHNVTVTFYSLIAYLDYRFW